MTDLLAEATRVWSEREGTDTGPMAGPDGSPVPATGRPVSIPFAGVHVVRGLLDR